LTRMIHVCLLTMYVVLLNLQPQGVAGLGQGITGHGQGITRLVATGPPLNCGIFSTGKPVDLDPMSSLDQEKMLNRYVACIGANSFLDIDGFYFLNAKGMVNGNGKFKKNGLMVATSLGFNDIARTLIHYDANINVRNKHGATSLHFAAWNGNTNMVGILLGLGANVNGADILGATPLYFAASHGHMNIVRLLLEKGADFTIRIPGRSLRRYTALEGASINGHTDVVALLQSWGR